MCALTFVEYTTEAKKKNMDSRKRSLRSTEALTGCPETDYSGNDAPFDLPGPLALGNLICEVRERGRKRNSNDDRTSIIRREIHSTYKASIIALHQLQSGLPEVGNLGSDFEGMFTYLSTRLSGKTTSKIQGCTWHWSMYLGTY